MKYYAIISIVFHFNTVIAQNINDSMAIKKETIINIVDLVSTFGFNQGITTVNYINDSLLEVSEVLDSNEFVRHQVDSQSNLRNGTIVIYNTKGKATKLYEFKNDSLIFGNYLAG